MPTTAFDRRQADPAHKRAPKRVGIAETARAGHLLERDIVRLEEAANGPYTDILHIDGRGQAGLGPEQAREVAWAHPGSFGKAVDAVIPRRVCSSRLAAQAGMAAFVLASTSWMDDPTGGLSGRITTIFAELAMLLEAAGQAGLPKAPEYQPASGRTRW